MTTEKAIKAITDELAPLFVELDAKVLEETKVWGERRRVAVKNKRTDLFGMRREMGEHSYYAALFAAAGGKSWFNTMDQGTAESVEQAMEKHCKLTIEHRNRNMAAKLIKAEVSSVVSSDYARSNDGFHGTFVVETNKGRKVVTIQTIYAGGWNIQCAHMRTLIRVK